MECGEQEARRGTDPLLPPVVPDVGPRMPVHSKPSAMQGGRRASRASVHVALALVQFCFSGWHLVGKFVLPGCGMPPLVFALYRELAASVVMAFGALMVEGFVLPRTEHTLHFCALGFLYFGNVGGFIVGLSLTSASNAAMLQALIPVVTAQIAVAMGTETLTSRRLLGVLAATLGGGALAYFSATAEDTARTDHGRDSGVFMVMLGNALLIVEVTCIAATVVLQKRLLRHYPPVTITAWGYGLGCVITTFVCVPAYADKPGAFDVSRPRTIACLFYAVVFATVITYSLMTWATQHVKSSTVGTYMVLAPLLTSIACIVVFAQTPSLVELTCGAVILAGLLLVLQ